jgi:hypothetical protein
MQRTTYGRTGTAGWSLIILGVIVSGIAVLLMFTLGGSFQPAPSGGNDFVPTQDGPFWVTFAAAGVGVILIILGVFAKLLAWLTRGI